MITQNTTFENSENQFTIAFKELKLGKLLNKSGIRKAQGASAYSVFQFPLLLVFQGKNLFRFLSSKHKEEACSKNTYYWFLNESKYNWRKFLYLLTATVTGYFNTLTRPEHVNVLVPGDSVVQRKRSKKVELLAKVYDHVLCTVLLICISCVLFGCKRTDDTYMDYIKRAFSHEESTPINKEEFEDILSKGISENMYYYVQDENRNYIGEKVDYIALGAWEEENKRYQILIFINPPVNTKLSSTHTFMLLYDNMKGDIEISTGNYNGNLNLMEYVEDSYFANELKIYKKQDLKIWYQGRILIKELTEIKSEQFEGKQKIIDSIYQWLEIHPDYYNIPGSEKVTVYIKDFDEYDADTIVLILPEQGMTKGININYNIVLNSGDESPPLHYADMLLEDEVIYERVSTLVNRVIETAVSIKEISIQ